MAIFQKLRAREAARAGQSRDIAVPEAAFGCINLSKVVDSRGVAVPLGFECFGDKGVVSKVKWDPDW